MHLFSFSFLSLPWISWCSNTHYKQDYHVFVRDLSSLLPFISLFLHSQNKDLQDICCSSLKQDRTLCDTVQALFISLSDIFHCWVSSQYFRREFQGSMHQLARQARFHLSLKSAGDSLSRTNAFKRAQMPGHCRNQLEKPPNFILLCLELLLPVYDGLISVEDKPLLDMCTSKLGTVRLAHTSNLRYYLFVFCLFCFQ